MQSVEFIYLFILGLYKHHIDTFENSGSLYAMHIKIKTNTQLKRWGGGLYLKLNSGIAIK